jgi:hypothetical protein
MERRRLHRTPERPLVLIVDSHDDILDMYAAALPGFGFARARQAGFAVLAVCAHLDTSPAAARGSSFAALKPSNSLELSLCVRRRKQQTARDLLR